MVKKPTWTKVKGGYKSNMSTRELNDYQKKTGKQVYPPNDIGTKVKGINVLKSFKKNVKY